MRTALFLLALAQTASAAPMQIMRPFGTYAYPHVRPDPAYGGHAVPEKEKSVDRRAYEGRMWHLLKTYDETIRDLRAAADGLPRRSTFRLGESLRLAAGNRIAAQIKLDELSSAPNDAWAKEKPEVEQAFSDLRASIGASQIMVANQRAS